MKIIFGAPRAAGAQIRLNQCPACHRVFGGMKGFELHRVGFECTDPERIGLQVTATKRFQTREGVRSFPVWSRAAPPQASTTAAVGA